MVEVVFLHPDLGIGGAERLVVDAALALRRRGCGVQIWTAHFDHAHCFSECRRPALPVHCVGDWLPRTLLGRCSALCAYLRMLYVAWYLVFLSGVEFDVVFCDQVSACIPVLRLCRRAKRVLFYCHFPDRLLQSGKPGPLQRLYRLPIDWLEEYTTGLADLVLVNSKFTAGVFRRTFRSLSHLEPDVLYPSLSFAEPAGGQEQGQGQEQELLPLSPPPIGPGRDFIFLSINRFERKKNLGLALRALHCLRDLLGQEDWQRVHLVLAGGYDPRVLENVEHYRELQEMATQLQLADKVTFLRSFSDQQKVSLLRRCRCVLYTPSNEHFGIVPLEAMYSRRPVIAVNSGGPLESVVDQVTGFLRQPSPSSFAEAMEKLVRSPDLGTKMGEAGKSRVLQTFSVDAFTEQLYQYICKLTQ
ncbi:alpha-1,3/1,6-mannosyltransferase ALG2 [Hemiscyllium ocellatum]|uniref:alpha-1,3/1,6-mannosyltransferase ALG2 n=1 Tax=Hemiscyllium ocellatum TaxID=170820 RepID=UPI002967583E|nr:alpha-1,3/1,6-mannosyltransferase ALG2 [Hemiscyllium ocellatum]